MEITDKIEKSASELIEKTKKDLAADNWLKKAMIYETKKDYAGAIDAYLKFLEIKLHIIQTRPEHGINSYLGLVKYYLKIAECYENARHINLEEKEIDIENAAKYYIKAAGMFNELKDHANVQKYYETAARCYESVKKYNKAAECHLKIADMYNKLNEKVLTISAYNTSANFYDMAGDYKKSVNIWLNIASLNLDTGNIPGASSSYKKVGDCYKKMGGYQEALSYYMKSAGIITGTENYSKTAEIYESIALDYEDLKDYENAIHYHLKSADLNIKINEDSASSSYRSIAACYEKLGKYGDAIGYYLKSSNIESKLKRYTNLASCCKGMAKCYEELNEYKKSADTYFQSAEYASVEGKSSNAAKEGYRKAAEIYDRIAEEGLNKKDYEVAIGYYKKIADCYDRTNDYGKSAETYRKYADIMKSINYGDAIHAYIDAAKRYKASKDIKEAAYYYAKAGDYVNSAKFYKEYAMLNKNNQFLAAEGYRMAAHSYKKLKKENEEKEYSNRAISQYLQHLEKQEYTGEKINKGGIYNKIAECYNELEDMPNTKKNLEEALKFYDKESMEKQIIPVNALLSKANAKLAMKTGDYPAANKLLNDALALFDKSIKDGNFDEEYNTLLEENKNEVTSLLGQIKLKPILILDIEQPVQPPAKGNLEIKGAISNKGGQEVYNVLLLPTIPPEFQIVKSPERIEVLKPNESKDISIQLSIPPVGEFKFAPLEVLYKDMAGNKYMKSSNEILINAGGLHGEYKKETVNVGGGYTYFVEETVPDRSINIFADIVNNGANGLYVSREHPDKIKSRFPSNVSVIWLSSLQERKNIINPANLVELGHIIKEFIEKNRNSAVLFDGIEYLIIQNGYDAVLKFIHSINDAVISGDSCFIIPINPKALTSQQLTLLEREGKVL